MKSNSFKAPTVVTEEKWIAARRELLREEKELTRLHDSIAARRRALPWTKVSKAYTFESPTGPVSLGDLFEGRTQLAVYHFMLGRSGVTAARAAPLRPTTCRRRSCTSPRAT